MSKQEDYTDREKWPDDKLVEEFIWICETGWHLPPEEREDFHSVHDEILRRMQPPKTYQCDYCLQLAIEEGDRR